MNTLAIPSTSIYHTIELLKLEAKAINIAAERLQFDQVEKALKLLATCQGKVVITGVGKSGIVAQKIAATLTSIGTVAICLHACDALHGDLGIVTGSDIAILLSNGGETDELIEILPHLKYRQVPIITIVGNLESTLAQQADVVLNAGVDREACPLNLAPTASTTVALAIGDALAMTLTHIKGVTPEAFAFNHPAGRLGKRLTLKVADLMQQKANNQALGLEASWLEIVSAITNGGAGAVNIVDDKGCLLGLITDGDLRRWVQKISSADLSKLKAGQIMTTDPVTVTPDILAYEAFQIMENRVSQISVLPVVDSNHVCLGLLRLHDVLRSGLV
ncbi:MULTISPECIES: KpsF/GutQ family sugar-phosphate isomerase [unclassified Moorena]|uniref:KpsF/GutQ family sugar-phosphate isomerase n=1 Tax=unclassified Moorena TaxID=2683338 RepID=UPI0013F8D604|nr:MULTISPECIES: KpsF/GutQ family sugar-phosphate isomerase [unclassified Moorena]NEP22332.1 KpsF/GutQ family sugar-phosphate isomerase [Moorena sp. SIO3I6]NEQ62477.1 KpsF/GutQ family sugar-phosphate isomerase [Moorena sp. SIO4A1]